MSADLMYKQKVYRKRFWYALWSDNGKPREGVVFDCYKGIKKLTRKISRQNVYNLKALGFNKLNTLFGQRKMSAFWNLLKNKKKTRVQSNLHANDLADYYRSIMQDDKVMTTEHREIESKVDELFCRYTSESFNTIVCTDSIKKLIGSLKRGCAPGIDMITSEHLIYGLSDILCEHLARLVSIIMSKSVVPHVFSVGIIVPVLKKPTLNPNKAENYRPITLSSIYSKLVERLMVPESDVSNNQLGFRQGRGTSFGSSLLNDVIKCSLDGRSPLYVCSLDAEKCFDKIWHHALFF
jgi:hypothetical protein